MSVSHALYSITCRSYTLWVISVHVVHTLYGRRKRSSIHSMDAITYHPYTLWMSSHFIHTLYGCHHMSFVHSMDVS